MNNTSRNAKFGFRKGVLCALGFAVFSLSGLASARSTGISFSDALKASEQGATTAIKAQLMGPLQTQIANQATQIANQVKQFNLEEEAKGIMKGGLENQINLMQQNLQEWGGSSITRAIESMDDSYFSSLSDAYGNDLPYTRNDSGVQEATENMAASTALQYESALTNGQAPTASEMKYQESQKRSSNAAAHARAASVNARSIKRDDYIIKGLSDDNASANGALQAQQIGNAATIEGARQTIKLRDAMTSQAVYEANVQNQIAEKEAKEAAWEKGFWETAKISSNKGSGF